MDQSVQTAMNPRGFGEQKNLKVVPIKFSVTIEKKVAN